MTAAVTACAGPGVKIIGFVDDVSAVYDHCRVFVAPLRFGAGLKGKVAGALARGVPCVLSPIADEGLDAVESGAAYPANTPEQWVDAIATLYLDRKAWTAASAAALTYSAKRFRFSDAKEQLANALRVLERKASV